MHETTDPSGNADARTVKGFGEEWAAFDQADLDEREREELFDQYFDVFPWEALPAGAEGFDLGCGSGRWAMLVAPRVGVLHCIDPSPEALAVAQRNLRGQPNCRFHRATIESAPLKRSSMDFGYSLGVLHHVPDPAPALRRAVELLKPSAPLLVYLYYALENRPGWFKALWKASDRLRRVMSALPFWARYGSALVIAALVYWPLARSARIAERVGLSVENFPLSFYRRRSFYTMRTDALDRFGTSLEHRFTRDQIQAMLHGAGLGDIRFSDSPPYWCVVGYRRH